MTKNNEKKKIDYKAYLKKWLASSIEFFDKLSEKISSLLSKKPFQKRKKFTLKQDDLDFIAECKSVEYSKKSPLTNVIYITIFLLLIFIVWSYFGEIDQVTVAEGKVVPSSRVQTLQSLDGGVVEKLFIKKDQVVTKNQVLMQLDLTRYAAEYKATLSRFQVLQAVIARLQAQAEFKRKIDFPQHILKNRPDLVNREQKLFDQKRHAFENHTKTLERSYVLSQTEISIVSPLVKEGLISKLELLRLQRESNEFKGEVDDAKNEYRDTALSQLNETKAEFESIKESMKSLKDRTEKATIRSPVDGVVNKIYIHTVGGVVKPGDNLMQIVPVKDLLLIEAKLTPSEVAFIHPNQSAIIKITAYDFSIYGGLKGKVQSISPDTIEDEKGDRFFHVLVKTNTSFLKHNGKELPIIPGMTASVHIMTGKQSVLEYLLKPLIKAKSNALRER